MADPSNAQDKSVSKHEFDEDTRRQLAEEDSFAWRSVTGLLITIIGIGLLIAILAVSLAH